jgi:acetylornithine/succinyldiaminopimelate/putrescine aminotransferase/acyl-coenzyme A synthetase/AMP-(fatty) acid ligase/predicted amino acid dehydrogenase
MNLAIQNIVEGKQKKFFDQVIDSDPQNNDTKLKNLGALLFHDLPGRDDRSTVIISHINEELVSITLKELRNLVSKLFLRFHDFGIKKGDTVFLASLECNSEIYIAILFLALCSYGTKVFLPMYLEKDLVEKWNSSTRINFMIIPGEEIFKLNHHDRQKNNIVHLKNFAGKAGIPCLDIFTDLHLNEWVIKPPEGISQKEENLIRKTIEKTRETDIALMITTSGTSGESKIIMYDHQSFLINISAWRKSGLYNAGKLGGRGFTPLFTHTMGIRTFLNALWLGNAVILINTEWFTEKPEAVRYFLSQSRPEHITGGPAVFNMLLELSRIFPDLKKELRKCLKTIVSSGTAVNEEVIRKLKVAFSISPQNAFGTTETQQVLSTLVCENGHSANFKSLGGLLPGVSIGLKKIDHTSNTFRLYIKSPYGGIRIIERNDSLDLKNKYIYLGDTVKFVNGRLFYLKREQADYINDEFGVKIPIDKVKKNYQTLFESVYHVKILPLKFKPGLAAIIFINNSIDFKTDHDKKKTISEIHSLIEKSNHELYKTLEPLEFNHWTINRFSCIQADNIENRKGIISNYKIERDYTNLIREITEDNRPKSNIEEVRSIHEKSSSYSMYHNPYIGKLLACLDMDISYEWAEGDHLYCPIQNQEKEILDLTGGYGTNLLGHHHGELIDHATQFLKSKGIPISDQLSLQKYPGQLAEKLNEMISRHTKKSYFTLLGSTGSEAVEISIHHAYLEWMKKVKKLEEDQITKYSYGREIEFRKVWESNWEKINQVVPVIIANKKAFHGTSSGARSMMGDVERRNKFSGILKLHTAFINDADPDFKDRITEAINSNKIEIQLFAQREEKTEIIPFDLSIIIAAIVEPVLGEGGIREINPVFPKVLSTFEFPLIVDEIQSGLGRTGSFLASHDFIGNYYLFSKALGGNIAKISAISIEKERFIEEIGKLYVSTFAGGGFAAKIALENLRIIEREHVPEKARTIGHRIFRMLDGIRRKYPDVIESIQGRGLMIGIKFSPKAISENLFLRILDEKKVLGYLFSSYLLHNERIRILPSISAPNMLRIEPSVCFSTTDIRKLSTGIGKLADLVHHGRFYDLVKHLIKGDPYIDNKGKKPEHGFLHTAIDEPSDNAVRVAFIAHFAYPVEEFRMLSKELIRASDTGIRQLFSKFEVMMDMEPFVLYAKNLYGGRIHLTTILLPLDSSELEKLHKTGKRDQVIRNIQRGVQLAVNRGAKIISLGGYTSIISNNGKAILAPGNTKIVTGNTLTAVVGYHNFICELHKMFRVKKYLKIGVVGANGNIGKVLASQICEDSSIPLGELVLFSRNLTKLQVIKEEILSKSGRVDMKIKIDSHLNYLNRCDAFIVAVNTNDPIIYPEHIRKNGLVLITDLSVPRGISEEILHFENVKVLSFASSIRLSEDPDFMATSCSPRGTALCCMAEAFLNGIEDIPCDLRGDISHEGFNRVYDLARKLGLIQNTDSLRSFKSRARHEVSV